MSDKSQEERIAALEKQVEKLKSARKVDSSAKWLTILLLGIWFAIAAMSFSPIGTTIMEEAIGAGIVLTLLLLVLF